MLLRFAVSNHLSIKDTQELSFIKSALRGPEDGLLSTPALPKDKVLPAAIIYGPNASGKTNLLDALAFMQSAVLSSHREWSPDAGISRSPFLLNKDCLTAPSRFEMDFVVNDVRHNYGFTCSSSEFLEEWLYEAPRGRQRMIFERKGPRPDDMKFGSSFTGQRASIAQLMRPNSLFLSVAFQNNHFIAKEIVSAFDKIIVRRDLETKASTLSIFFANGSVDSRIISLLGKLGTGIVDYRRIESERPDFEARIMFEMIKNNALKSNSEMTEEQKREWKDTLRKDVRIEFSHKSDDDIDVFLDVARESAGTRRLTMFLRDVMVALDQGHVCVIDEIDASLHTQVCDAIIALFTNSKTNPNGAQIIATTHDTNLFNAPHLRRDELWLVEKSPGGASEFYSLADVKVRDTDNYERGYLQGRYGAIPFSGSAIDLVKSL